MQGMYVCRYLVAGTRPFQKSKEQDRPVLPLNWWKVFFWEEHHLTQNHFTKRHVQTVETSRNSTQNNLSRQNHSTCPLNSSKTKKLSSGYRIEIPGGQEGGNKATRKLKRERLKTRRRNSAPQTDIMKSLGDRQPRQTRPAQKGNHKQGWPKREIMKEDSLGDKIARAPKEVKQGEEIILGPKGQSGRETNFQDKAIVAYKANPKRKSCR